jgi:mycothiol synthase
MLTHRPAADVEDLATAGGLMSAAWRAEAPHVAETPAAIEWWYAVTHPDPLDQHLRLWFDDGRPVAWTWHEPPELECHVWTGDAGADADLFGAIIRAVDTDAGEAELGAFAADDDAASIGVLRERGFEAAGRVLTQWQRRVDDDAVPGPAVLPDGYRIRGVRGADEFAARVELHRAAFPKSRLTAEKYERLLTVPHYRFEDDLVVEAPDGTLAAFALTWYDAVGRVGELEPVGTHPEHQRRGLSRAIVTAAVGRLFERGARTVQVYSDASEAPAEALYPAVGFRRRATHRRYAIRSPRAADATIDA